jgi:hypothetical protein
MSGEGARLTAFSSGGPDALPALIRTRLRTLIDAGVPTPGGLGCLWEWRCRQQHPCGGCGALITKGAIEVEIITRGGIALILHQRCLELWEQEARATPAATARPELQRRRNPA